MTRQCTVDDWEPTGQDVANGTDRSIMEQENGCVRFVEKCYDSEICNHAALSTRLTTTTCPVINLRNCRVTDILHIFSM